MNKYTLFFLLILLVVYIVSPLDLFPFVFDDLIALGFLLYFWRKFKNRKNQRGYNSGKRSQSNIKSEPVGQMSLDEAYKLLNVSHETPWSEVQKAYKEKMAKSHPDKVAHLGKELQEKAEELTVEINKAYNIIKRYKS
ncbi:heat shock protein [Candidatus Scalindua japonica]|uniref:Heat shock protein n=1 Tax=Candidatus Scalindua japonica TaxID=1284222 RepID=A0A286U1D3_9BACT|nr:DnaJ domain-containing protein [Candidatus Scalindua japonica]GAX61949.1 heat shock protein [Candidatus Scalindua japonica]